MLKVAGGTGTPGAIVYKGTWDALNNVPFLQSGVGNNGDYYIVSVAGNTNLDGITDWQVNDWAVFNGTTWEKIDNTDAVLSVNGQTGAVVLTAANVGATPNTTYVLAGTGLSGGGQLTGNVTLNLANTTVASGTYGNATNVPQVTVDAQGRITSASNVAISIPGMGTVTNIATGTGLTGGPITTTGTISIANTAVTAGTYGSNGAVSQVTINAQGQVTNAVNVGITIPVANVTGAVPSTVYVLAGTNLTGGGALTGNVTINNPYNGTVTNVATGTGLTGGPITGSGTISLANTTVTAATYGSANQVPQFTVDAQGRLSNAVNVPISLVVANVAGAVPNTRSVGTGTGLTGGGTLASDLTLSVVANTTQQLVGVQNNGVAVATRQIVNFIPGNNVTISTADDSANGRANVTIGDVAAATFATSVTTPVLNMNGATSGTVTVNVPAIAGTTNFTLPSSNGTNGYVLQTNGSGVTSWVAPPAGTLTVGSTATSGGAAGQIMFDTGSVLQESSNLVWDNTNNALTLTSVANPVVPTLKVVGASNFTGTTLSGVSITGIAGQFSCNAASLAVGQFVTISGTLGGTGSITGYSNPTTYLISATNGSTTFTLVVASTGAAIVTTAGTPTGLTYTVTAPAINVSETWNNSVVAFSGLKLNVTDTASNASSLLMDLQVGGASKLSISKTGTISGATDANLFSVNTVNIGTSLKTGSLVGIGGNFLLNSSNSLVGFAIGSNMPISWSTNNNVTNYSNLGSVDLYLTRRGAANLRFGQADAAAPVAQTLSVQSVVAGTSNTAGANLTITGSQGTGTGVGGDIIFQVAPAGTAGTAQNALATALRIYSNQTVAVGKAYTVATLPAAGTQGRRAWVTDATAPTFLGTLIGGGSVVTPVFDNGTAWVSA